MNNLESYLGELQKTRATAVPETGAYAALEKLLDAVGALLTPPVNAVIHPKSSGAGIPDLGLYDEKLSRADTKPSRGVVEAKGTSANLMVTATSEQVKKYLDHYGQVLVTNLYQFILVRRGDGGAALMGERYDLAPDEKTFWATKARTLATEKDTALTEYLQRVMLQNAPLTTPKDVAAMLASYARVAKTRLNEASTNLDALDGVRGQLESALGVRFEDAKSKEFFKSTLVQTLFYGVFSAWVLWHERNPRTKTPFDLWRDTRELHVPVIQEIFQELSKPRTLRSPNIEEVLNWTTEALNRVDRTAFFTAFEAGDAVQYFYEPFLEAFDKKLRKQLGVWYTPREVVRYMVARVDAALRDELGIADGLADERVVVLDPCCGTGAYLVEVLNLIHQRLTARDGEVMAAQEAAKAMQTRIFGFELLPAPFVVAHLQLGLLLTKKGAALRPDQRAGIYLTNALTGWEIEKDEEGKPKPKQLILLPELAKERDAADGVKQNKPILVILGNPPYSGYAGMAVDEERALTNSYRKTKRAPKPQGQGLNDLYVRFFRMAERKISEGGRGVVCYISNYSWLDGLSHTGMREHFLDTFDSITIDNLNGDKYRTGKTTPDGKPDPSVFSTEFNREGIQVGTAIATLVRHLGTSSGISAIQFRDVWGNRKRAQLNSETKNFPQINYETVHPILELSYPLIPLVFHPNYLTWPKLPELFPESFSGVKTSRDDFVVDIDFDPLKKRVKRYFDPDVTDEVISEEIPSAMRKTEGFNPSADRAKLVKRGLEEKHFVRYSYRPLDTRWLYWEKETKLLDGRRTEYFPQIQNGNFFMTITAHTRRPENNAPLIHSTISDINIMDGSARAFPLYFYPTVKQDELMPYAPRPNLSDRARAYLDSHSTPP